MLPVQSLWPPLKNICQEASLNVTKPKPAESLIARYEGRKRKTPQQDKTSGQKVVPAHAPRTGRYFSTLPVWTDLNSAASSRYTFLGVGCCTAECQL